MQVDADSSQPFGDSPPIESGYADFSQVWQPLDGDFDVPAAPDLPDGFAEAYAATLFKSFDDIDGLFCGKTGASFIAWFNASLAGKAAWAGKKISAPNAEPHFSAYWDSFARASSVKLMEFAAYMSIFINERNGDLVSQSELFGMKGHPGVAYLFDSFDIVTRAAAAFARRPTTASLTSLPAPCSTTARSTRRMARCRSAIN